VIAPQDEEGDGDDETNNRARELRRLDRYQQEITRLQQEKD
jgi:hypothetical protein